MSVTHKANWLHELLAILDRPPDLVVHPTQDGPTQPVIDFGPELPAPHPVKLPAARDQPQSWKDELTAALVGDGWSTCLIYPMAFPARPRAMEEGADDRRFHDEAAFLAAALEVAGPARTFATLVSMNLLTSAGHAPFRTWLADRHRPAWILYFGPSASTAMGIHPSFRMGLLVVDSGPREADGGVRLVRLADLRELELTGCRAALLAAARRGGGEVGPTIVLRDPQLDENSWTYERFSRQFQAVRDDARELGSFTTLGDLAESLRLGLNFKSLSERLVELDEHGAAPNEAIACYSGRSLQADGGVGAPRCAVRSHGLEKEHLLAPGDLLIRAVAHPSQPLVVAQVDAQQAPAVVDHSVVVLRFKAEVTEQSAELIRGYLRSRHARDWLIANGVGGGNLQVRDFSRLEVPVPRREILEALDVLANIEDRYRLWASDLEQTRRQIFAATSYAETVPELLARQRLESERFRAAEDTQSLDYRVRNYYPYPISLRRELLLQREHGKERLSEMLECTEHLMTVLALMAMVQIAPEHEVGHGLPASLQSFVKKDALLMDWGKWFSLIDEATAFTVKQDNLLALPFPELHQLVSGEATSWRTAERRLRDQRNRQAHLQRVPENELRELSETYSGDFDVLLEGVAFLATAPLAHVADYVREPLTGERTATFELLQGPSRAFKRQQLPVAAECPRGAVGFLDHRQVFRSLSPWLMLEACPRCQQRELFVFNRFENDKATYVALESGHPNEKSGLGELWARILRQ